MRTFEKELRIANQLTYRCLSLLSHRLTFVESSRQRGTMANYELNYNYQLKKVLKSVHITPVEVIEEDFRNLSVHDKARFFIQKTSDFYKKK